MEVGIQSTQAESVPTANVRGRISVIMPCFNAERHLAAAAASALAQTYANVELIVIDDGSTDASPAIAAAIERGNPGRVTLLHTARVGPYPARNEAIRVARGDYVAFLDADDWWEPTALEKLHSAISTANADIAYCGWQNVGTGIKADPFVPPEYEKDDPVAHFLRTCPWPIHAALVDRSLVRQLNGFSERRFSSMDYDFWLRALAVTRKIVRVPEVLAYYRWHDAGQISAVRARQVLDALEAQRQFIRTNPALVKHLPARQVRDCTEGRVRREAYRALWNRDLPSAQCLFRHMAWSRSFSFRELPYVASALLPLRAYRWIVGLADKADL